MKRWIPLLLSLVMVLSAGAPVAVFAEDGTSVPETVRVGFFAMDGYHEIDANGRKSGYGYDFLQLTEKYVNLNYEYVGYDKTWEESVQMLLDGEIDLLTSAHMSEEHMEQFEFSMPIGTSSVSINTRTSETRFVSGDYSTYDGMTIGLLEGSDTNKKVEAFAGENNFHYQAKYYKNFDALSDALESGEVDAIASSSLREMENEKILSEFSSEYFYAIVKKGNTELIEKINYAIEQLDSSEGDWQNTFYYNNYSAHNYDSLVFTEEETQFIRNYSAGGKKLVIATDAAWEPFSWKEGDTYVGILPEYIEACMEICGIEFEYYDSDENLYEIPDGEGAPDLYIDYSMDEADVEEAGLVLSSPLLETGAAYLQRRDTARIKTVAISEVTPYLNTYLDVDDDVTVVDYSDTEAAKQAVQKGKVDAALLYSYDAEYTVNQDKTGTLAFSVLPDVSIQIRAGIRDDTDHVVMSILMKCINHMSDAQKSSILSKYVSFSATQLTLKDYIIMHPAVAGALFALLLIVIFIVLLIGHNNRREKAHRLALEGKINEITELNHQLRENQTSLVEARRQAEAANDAKTTFLFNMSHDIRTPMNAIIGFTDLLEKHQEEPEKRADYLSKIRDSSTVLLSIINNVLEMARIEKGTVECDEVAWSADQFSNTLYSVFEEMMKGKHIAFTRQIEVEHHYVFCDPNKLREVFINLLSNAYKYTNEGGSVNMRLEEIPSDREGYVVFQTTIADTGMGMAKEFLPHIFEEFSRENNTTDNKIEGTGLGMPIVKRLVELMDGTITVESEKGKGSTFVVTFPHKIAAREDLKVPAEAEPEPESFVGKRILLAEDNELNAEIATEILTEAGFEVDHAQDGQICVDMVQRAEDDFYDVVLMDVQMPNMNGYEATRAIRAFTDTKKAHIRILAMTANAFEEDKREAYRAGMDGHLAKPINVRALMKALAGVLN